MEVVKIGRFSSAENQVMFKYESGTFGTVSGTSQWPGLVQTHDPDEEPNVINARFLGGGDRNVDQFIDGALDFPGAITTFPQDWKFLAFAMGSNVDAGSPSPYTHAIREQEAKNGNAFTSGPLNPWFSFTLEDAQQFNVTGLNFVRTFGGCVVDSLTIAGTQGEPISMDVNYIAQTQAFSSGAITAVTEDATRPYMWSDTQLHIPSGTVYQTLMDFSWTINNNMLPAHYLNGSREIAVQIPQNRDYEFAITLHATSERTKTLYDQFYLGGSTFNTMLQITASAGSKELFLIMSGCKITGMDAPSPNEGINEQSITIIPGTCSANAEDLFEKYNPW